MDYLLQPKKRKQEDVNKRLPEQPMRRFKMSKIHPLLIDHVVESIFDYLPPGYQDLLQVRMVCSQWRDIGTNTLRKKSKSLISFGKFRHSAEKMKQLIGMVESDDHSFPFHKWKLNQDIFKKENEKVLREFFLACSEMIETLTIWFDVESSLEVPSGWIPQLNLDKLKCLVFDDRRRSPEEHSLKLIENILVAAPNVEELTLIFPTESRFPINRNAENGTSRSVNELVELLETFGFPRLTGLKLDMEINNELLTCLSKRFGKLETLHLCLRTSKFNEEFLKLFLESQKDSLKHLKMTDLCKGAQVGIDFPELKNLNLLEIHAWDNSIGTVRLNKISYKQHMPNLQQLLLSIWLPDSGFSQFFPRADAGTSNLRFIKLPQDFHCPELIDNISKFVSLTKLEMHYSYETVDVLQAVFRYLHNLKELKLNQSFPGDFIAQNLDHIFTGIPAVECDKINKFKRYFIPKSEIQNLQANPGLTNLQNLTTLDMKDLHYQAIVTDVTGYFAFLRMEKLHTLIMGRSQIDESCLLKLVARFPHTMTEQLHIPKMKLNHEYTPAEVPSKCSLV